MHENGGENLGIEYVTFANVTNPLHLRHIFTTYAPSLDIITPLGIL